MKNIHFEIQYWIIIHVFGFKLANSKVNVFLSMKAIIFVTFQELFELAQRKILRQLSFYAEVQDVSFPRLFVVDFVQGKENRYKYTSCLETEYFDGRS